MLHRSTSCNLNSNHFSCGIQRK